MTSPEGHPCYYRLVLKCFHNVDYRQMKASHFPLGEGRI